jgi:hypothetical protein
MIRKRSIASMSILSATTVGVLSLSCGSQDVTQGADASHTLPHATPATESGENESSEALGEPTATVQLTVKGARLVDSVRWYESMMGGSVVDSGFHHRVELETSAGFDTIPVVFAIDQPVIRAGSTEVVGLMHQDGRRSGFFTYRPGDIMPELHTQFGSEYRIIIDPKLSPDGHHLAYSVSDKNYHLWAEVRSWPDLELLMATDQFETAGCGVNCDGISWVSNDSIVASIFPCGRIIRFGGSVNTGSFLLDSVR